MKFTRDSWHRYNKYQEELRMRNLKRKWQDSPVESSTPATSLEGRILLTTFIVASALAIIGLFFSGCTQINVTGSSLDINPMRWWKDSEIRIELWLSWHSECEKQGYIRPKINGVFENDVETCLYLPSSRVLYVNPDPKLREGCMAHELGHAALHQAGNTCWREFEHDLGEAR